jgi:parallel beta-helix repeat protein
LTGNTASYNAGGIALHSSSNNNTLTANTTSHNNTGFGICISNCNNNTLEDNNASNNWHGILLSECSSNTLTGNVVSCNTKGIRIIHNSDNNQIYNNNFIANTTQATVGVDSSGNIFNLDKPIGGNYWSDWTTPDDDSDGFVDFPYEFTGGQDDLPWADPDGWACRDPREMIQELADQAMSLNLQHGISNSLDAKLAAALQALEDVNENNDAAAINTLEAFINAVEAQSGSKIPQADADALIFKARKIIDCMRGT